MKQNCWEIKECDREFGGARSRELGVCPATTEEGFDGVNSGKKGGRICWAVTGTLCGGEVQGTFAKKRASCMACEVFKTVKKEEGDDFQLLPQNKR